jgi:hypothetical protein
MESCECIKLHYAVAGHGIITIDLQSSGLYNGFNYFEFIDNGVTFYIWYNFGSWALSENLGDPFDTWFAYSESTSVCPIDIWNLITDFTTFSIDVGSCKCSCITIHQTFENGSFDQTFTMPTGFYNGEPYWSWCDNLQGQIFGWNLFMQINELDQCQWVVEQTKCGADIGNQPLFFLGELKPVGQCGCPFDTTYTPQFPFNSPSFEVENCSPVICVPIEDRHQRKYDAIQLPVIFDEQNRGWKGCCDCEPMITLASTDPETWKNDITSAWIKMSDPTDVVMFKLMKNGIDAIYEPTINAFINESDAYYTTINWIDVLNADGVGCYELIVEYNISGVIGSFIWGAYNLKPYTIENALKTARIRVKFNLQQEIEGINFTGTNIEDTIRFYGFIGERQPNMEIDNLIYQNRGMKTVVRENLNNYKITTDPSGECLITKLTDLYLLSENEMYISDYNAHNHSYKYLDLPVIVQESPEIDYLDILQRKAILTCEVADRSKNKRTFY